MSKLNHQGDSMFEKNVSILLILIVFLTAASPIRLNAQIGSSQGVENNATEADKNSARPDLRKLFAVSYDNTPPLDTKQLEKDNLNAPRRARLSKGQKTGLYLGIAAAAIAAVVIIVVVANKKE